MEPTFEKKKKKAIAFGTRFFIHEAVALRALAKKKEITISQVISSIVREYLHTLKK